MVLPGEHVKKFNSKTLSYINQIYNKPINVYSILVVCICCHGCYNCIWGGGGEVSVPGLLPLLDHHHGLGVPPCVTLGLGQLRSVTKLMSPSNHQDYQTFLCQAGWRPPDITSTLLAPEWFIC